MVPENPATLVDDPAGLAEAVGHLEEHDVIAFDTEFIGEETYYPRLCLVQVGSRERVYLIDPFAVEDLTPLLEVIASPDRATLVHAGRQDLQILARMLGRPARHVIDTQILAGLAGLPWPCSLSKSVRCAIKAPMPSGMTFTAWDARPLSARQLRYAADDVRYLPLLHGYLVARVASFGHEHWAAEAFAAFEDPSWHHTDLSSQRRKIEGTRRFKPIERRVLRNLVVARDEIARAENTPPRAAIPDNALLALTRDRPADASRIASVRGLPRPIAGRHGDRLVQAIAEAQGDTSPLEPQRSREESPDDRVAIDGLWHAFAAAAIGAGVSPALALSRAELANWYLNGREGLPGKASWQRGIIDSLLRPLLADGRALSLEWRDGTLRHTGEERTHTEP
jgi:ribonuclease D